MNTEHINIWCWIIPGLVGVIAGILGYLIGKGKNITVLDHTTDLQNLEEEKNKLQAELDACNKKLGALKTPVKPKPTSSPRASGSKEAKGFNAQAAKVGFGKRVKENDLKIVEGIGPKIEGLFHNFGIKTWKDLSKVSTNKCQEVLNSGGKRYRIHDPASWPMQAKMAYEGQWVELAKWQDKHRAGKF